jgi:hypothetical protein
MHKLNGGSGRILAQGAWKKPIPLFFLATSNVLEAMPSRGLASQGLWLAKWNQDFASLCQLSIRLTWEGHLYELCLK